MTFPASAAAVPPAAARPSLSGIRVQASLFEGLFVRALGVTGALRSELRRLGYDADAPGTTYPLATWVACIDAARSALIGDRSVEEGYREMGRLFVDGYFETVVGRVVASSLPLLGAHRAAASIPRFVGFGNSSVSVDATNLAERAWRYTFDFAPGIMSHFTAGWIEVGMRRTGVCPTVDVADVEPERFTILLRW